MNAKKSSWKQEKHLVAANNEPRDDLGYFTREAHRHADEQPYSKRPRWIVACNFAEFRVYDMEHPGADPEIIQLANLPAEAYRLQFLVNVKSRDIVRETQVSKEAGEIVGRLYDALLAQYKDPTNSESLKSLNKLCVRLVFLLYAESAGILGKRNMFREYLQSFREENVRRALIDLFEVLSTKPEDRDDYLEDKLAAFPYVNGGLFDGEKIEIPRFTPEILDLIIHQASEQFDWSAISPTIFGAVFESTMNPVARRAGGLHYTSVENIHKIIDPLFLDDFQQEFANLKAKKPKTKNALASWRQSLLAFQEKLAAPLWLDKRQAYLIQANGKRKSPKSLGIKGFGDCLLLGDSLLNGHFRRKRPATAHQVYLRVQMKRKSFDSLGNRLTVCTCNYC